MKISVKEHHITEGKQGNAEECPVALACFDAGLVAPSVGPVSIACGADLLNLTRYRLPDKATKFIRAFDSDAPVKPFEFEIDTKIPKGKHW